MAAILPCAGSLEVVTFDHRQTRGIALLTKGPKTHDTHRGVRTIGTAEPVPILRFVEHSDFQASVKR